VIPSHAFFTGFAGEYTDAGLRGQVVSSNVGPLCLCNNMSLRSQATERKNEGFEFL